MNFKEILKVFGFILLCQTAGIIGSFFTFDSISGWYAGLVKPEFSPPNWIFGPVWITLYTLMGISAYMVYKKGFEKKKVKLALAFFSGQLILNALWSILFFGLQSPISALVCIILLLFMIISTIVLFWRISKNAALLMIPYVLWVSFASILNYFIWALNP
jgi:tryptophan-rich sensory protein